MKKRKMENTHPETPPAGGGENVSKGRRSLLKAGWAIPVIAATPLLNTAAALSSSNCGDLYAQMDEAKKNGDKALYQALKGVARDAGCDLTGY